MKKQSALAPAQLGFDDLQETEIVCDPVSCRATFANTTVDFQGFPATIGKSARHERDIGEREKWVFSMTFGNG